MFPEIKKQEIPITYFTHVSVFMRQRGKSKTTSKVANLSNTFKGLYVCVCGWGGGVKGAGIISKGLNLPELKV